MTLFIYLFVTEDKSVMNRMTKYHLEDFIDFVKCMYIQFKLLPLTTNQLKTAAKRCKRVIRKAEDCIDDIDRISKI